MAITHIQTQMNAGGSGNTISVSLTDIIAGNALLVGIAQYIGVYGVNDISGGGNTYTQRVFENTHGYNTYIYEALNVSGGSYSVDFVWGGSTATAVFVSEIQGLLTAGAFDRSSKSSGASATSGNPGNILEETSQADEILYAIMAPTGFLTQTFTVGGGSGYTIPTNGRAESPSFPNAAVYYKIVTSTGIYDAPMTWTTASQWQACLATFKAAGGAPPPATPLPYIAFEA